MATTSAITNVGQNMPHYTKQSAKKLWQKKHLPHYLDITLSLMLYGLTSAIIKHVNISLIRLLSLFEYMLEDSGSAEYKEILLFSHDKLSLASILRPLHQVTKEFINVIHLLNVTHLFLLVSIHVHPPTPPPSLYLHVDLQQRHLGKFLYNILLD